MREYTLSLSFVEEPNVSFIQRIAVDNIFNFRFLTFVNPFTQLPVQMFYKKMSKNTDRPIYFYKQGTNEGGLLSG